MVIGLRTFIFYVSFIFSLEMYKQVWATTISPSTWNLHPKKKKEMERTSYMPIVTMDAQGKGGIFYVQLFWDFNIIGLSWHVLRVQRAYRELKYQSCTSDCKQTSKEYSILCNTKIQIEGRLKLFTIQSKYVYAQYLCINYTFSHTYIHHKSL